MTDAFPGPPGDDQAVPSPYPAAAAEPTPASDRKGLKIALILAMLAVVALGAMSIYLWTVHSEYVAQNEKLRETATELGSDLATSRATAQQLQEQLDQRRPASSAVVVGDVDVRVAPAQARAELLAPGARAVVAHPALLAAPAHR